MLAGMAKPMPSDPPLREKIAVLMPTSLPSMVTKAPPELPGLMAASVWMKKLKSVMPTLVRARAETMPLVTVWPTPKGLPMASTRSPTSRSSESLKFQGRQRLAFAVDAQHGQVGALVREHDLGLELAPVGQHHGDLVGALDDVMVGHDQAVRVDDHAGAERVLDALARAGRKPKSSPKKRLKNGSSNSGDARALADHLALGVDVDHRRRRPLDHRREGQATAPRLCGTWRCLGRSAGRRPAGGQRRAERVSTGSG